MAGSNDSHSQLFNPYGGRSEHSANIFGSGYSDPLGHGFGFFSGDPQGQRQSARWQSQMAGATGPTADFIRQGNAYLPQMFGDAQQLGTQLTGQTNQAFGDYQNAVNSFMSQLPNLQGKVAAASGPNAGLPYANQLAQQAFDPISSNAQYQNTLKGALDGSRAGAAARGTLDSGAAQADEERMARDLGATFAQNQTANQQNATQILGGLSAQDAATRQQGAGLEAQIGSMGPEAQQALFSAMPQFASLLQNAQQMPFQALQQYGNFLQGQQNPGLALLQATAPVLGQQSKGWNVL